MIYGFKTYPAKSGLDTFWIAESNQLNGCTAQGDTLDEALKELARNELEWLLMAEEHGIAVPEVELMDFGG